MKSRSSKSIRKRLLTSLVVSAIAIISLATSGFVSLESSQSIVASSSGVTTENMLAYFKTQSSLEEILGMYENLVKNEGANALKIVGEITQAKKKFEEELSALIAMNEGREAFLQDLEIFKEDFVKLDELGRGMAIAYVKGQQDEAKAKMGELQKAKDELKAAGEGVLKNISDYSVNQMHGAILEFEMIFLALGFVFLVLTLVFAYRSIVSVNRDLISFQNNLAETLQKNTKTIEDLNTYSSQLSGAATEQNASVQQSIAAMHEINRMLEKTNVNVSQCTGLMSESKSLSMDGENSIASMNGAMNELEKSEQDIKNFLEVFGQIKAKTEVINDIVFKTQLLSFNASIEAARAGQHGRGFAVVAEEVGQLAETSGKASSEIAKLLSESDNTVNQLATSLNERITLGKSASSDILDKFSGIKSNIDQVSQQMDEISSASKEQLIGTQEISKAFSHLQESTQVNNDTATSISEMAVGGVENNKVLNQLLATVKNLLGFNMVSKEKKKASNSVKKMRLFGKASNNRKAA